MATIGSAIGLGNVWKFPYITGMNGGGAFVIVYLFCILLLGVPVMICEMTIGRKTRRNAFGAYNALQHRRSAICNVIAAGLALGGICMLCSGPIKMRWPSRWELNVTPSSVMWRSLARLNT